MRRLREEGRDRGRARGRSVLVREDMLNDAGEGEGLICVCTRKQRAERR